jgi:hypothetical protein
VRGEAVWCEPAHADGPLENAAALRGRVALVMAGRCCAEEKALRAAGAGAAAVVVVADEGGVAPAEREPGAELALERGSGEVGRVVARAGAGAGGRCELHLQSGDLLSVDRAALLVAADLSIPVATVRPPPPTALPFPIPATPAAACRRDPPPALRPKPCAQSPALKALRCCFCDGCR